MSGTEVAETATSGLSFAQFLKHVQNPQNLLTYMIFTAWMKFMGIASHIPSVTVG